MASLRCMVSLLQYVVKIYMNNLYKVFENEYIKGEGCCQDALSSTETPYGTEHVYVVCENRFSKKFGFMVGSISYAKILFVTPSKKPM